MADKKQPDYDFTAYHKETGARSRIGAAWKNDDGSIHVRLDMFVTPPNGNGWTLTLWPRGERPSAGASKSAPPDADTPY